MSALRDPSAAPSPETTHARHASAPRAVPLDNVQAFAEVRDRVEHDYPGNRLSVAHIEGDSVLRADHGGMKIHWIYAGEGEVFLPAGYRTQEGGSEPLPAEYAPDPIDPNLANTLRTLQQNLAQIAPGAAVHVQAILQRWRGDVLLGDFPL